MTCPAVLSQKTLLSVLVCILVCAVHASTGSKSDVLAHNQWGEEASEANKWQTFNDWSCNAPSFAGEYPMVNSLASYSGSTLVDETFVWGQPFPKAKERILIFGAGKPNNGSVHGDETWIYSPNGNSWWKVDSLKRPPARIGYRLVTLCDTNVILLGGFQVVVKSVVWLHDVWMFDGYNEVWKEIVVANPGVSPLRQILNSVAVQAPDTDNKCKCNESVFFFTSTSSGSLHLSKLKCVDDDQMYEWVTRSLTSASAPADCLVRTLSYNPTTRYIHAMARTGLWRYWPTDDVWRMVNDSVKASDKSVAVHFQNDRGVTDRYVLFGNDILDEDNVVWVYQISLFRWFSEPVVSVPLYFYTLFPPIAALWGRLLTYAGTVKPCSYILWDITRNRKNKVWIWTKIETQRLSPSAITGPLTDTIGDRLFVLGGVLDPNFSSHGVTYRSDMIDLWQLSLNEMMWERLKPFRNSWVDSASSVSAPFSGGILHDSVFVVCGEWKSFVRNGKKNFETKGYMFHNRLWLQYGSKKEVKPRKLHTMVAINESSLLLFGGLAIEHNLVFKDTWILTLPDVNSSFVSWFQVSQYSGDVPNARYHHTMVKLSNGLVVLYGGTDNGGQCLNDIWHFNTTQENWRLVVPTNGGPVIARRGICYSMGSAIGSHVFFTVKCFPESTDCADSPFGLQVWMYSPHSPSWVFVSVLRTYGPNWSYSSIYWKRSLVIFDASKPQLMHTRLGCPRGYASPNISASASPCKTCQIGFYSAAGATNCTRCPNGLATEEKSSTSILNCSKCDVGQCQHGKCLVVQMDGIPRPTCQCSFGYTGDQCQYPTYFLIGLGIVAFVLLLVVAVGIILNVRAKKRRREAFLLHQVNELSNVWQLSDYEIELFERIGVGGYGEVFRAGYRDITVAVKVLRSFDDDRVNYEFEREIQFMQTIRHPNIVLFLGAGKFNVNGTPFIVVEYVEGGSVRDLLDNLNKDISVAEKVRFWADVARGMRFLHTLDPPRMHRDLKCSNLLMSKNGTVKIADFGLGRQVEHRRRSQHSPHIASPLLGDSHEMTVLDIGTVRWRAPELCVMKAYSTAVDVYSFAIVMWEIWTRQFPFAQYRFDYQVEDAIVSGERPATPADCPRDYRQLMMDCWQHNPEHRPTFVVIAQRVDLLLSQFAN